jgi:hypothetical protein
MKINTLTVSFSDIGRLLAAIEACDVTPPRALTEVLSAREKLAVASPVINPVKELIAAALDGRATPDKVDRALERTALARMIAAERVSLDQRIDPELLAEFGRRLTDSGADEVLNLLRPQFDQAADILRQALAIAGVPDDPAAFLNTASPEELAAYQSVAPAIAALNKIGAIASAFGPLGSFPCLADPRSVDPGIRCSWLHDVGTMCTNGDLLESCAAFQRPHPHGDVRTSPWLRCQPHLHSVDSATERLRAWCETEWAAQESQRPKVAA